MSEYTPGPWAPAICWPSDEPKEIVSLRAETLGVKPVNSIKAVAYCGHPRRPEAIANAQLIAAAPDLLAVAREALPFVVAAIEAAVDVPGFTPEDHQLVKKLRAAIARAAPP